MEIKIFVQAGLTSNETKTFGLKCNEGVRKCKSLLADFIEKEDIFGAGNKIILSNQTKRFDKNDDNIK